MKPLWNLLLSILLSTAVIADVQFGDGTKVGIATAEEGRKVLTAHDEFTHRMSPFDRAARLKTDQAVSADQFLKFVGANVVDFTAEEKASVEQALQKLATKVEPFKLSLPASVLVIKTTGKEEGEAAYTRGNGIVIPAKK